VNASSYDNPCMKSPNENPMRIDGRRVWKSKKQKKITQWCICIHFLEDIGI